MVNGYLQCLYDTIISRGHITVEQLENAPHHPDISTHPHHKHVGLTIEPAHTPDLSKVLLEIEQMIFDSD